ncbi:hypothetical protein LTR04_006652 [Oleoguttula sp. CCFEE 6159]|nr:hypothetical protein LTR04_006652 [Oleoguttula sp. CCFEE 6159]
MGKWRYGVILDAGSSGTRELDSLPVLKTKKKWTKKIHPGVSTFGDKIDLVGPDHLAPLLEHARDAVPAHEHRNTPIFLLATAGVRLLPDVKRKALLQEVCSYARKNTQFLLPDCDLHIQVIPGETEGLYGWIAANYLLGGFDADAQDKHDHGKGHHTYGFLDMGGASAQIAFAPNATEAEKHANDLKLLRMRTLSGAPMEHRVFVTTWLGFGVNEARRRFVQALTEASPGAAELPDPCLPKGLTVTKSGHVILPGSKEAKGKEAHLLGTGKFTECLGQTFPLLNKDVVCVDKPCLLNGVHVPAIDFDVNHFVGVSEYWHTTHEVFEDTHKSKSYDFHTYQDRVTEFCSQDWKTIDEGVAKKKWGKKVDETTAVEVCFKASWLINVLHNGIGVPRVGIEDTKGSGHNGTKAVLDHAKEKGFLDPFQAVDKIDDTEVSWTLGKMVLYAASQIPPADKYLAVGFGSNTAGIPPDFQYAGGRFDLLPNDLTDDKDDDWHDTIFNSDSPRRIPGFLLFLLIVCFAVFLLCGRERRTNLYQRLNGLIGRGNRPSKRRRGLVGKLFGHSNTPSYDRVMEDGRAADEFELGNVPSEDEHSDLSEGSGSSRVGRTSGWATPRLTIGGDNGSPSYFDNTANPGPGLGIGLPSAFERGGLTVRTESKERLAPAPGSLGTRSRTGSPTRLRSPMMMPLKESVD